MTWRGIVRWMDQDMDNVRPWSPLFVGLVACAILALVFALTDSPEIRDWSKVIVAGALLFIGMPYLIWRGSKNVLRETKQSIEVIKQSRGDDRHG